MMTKDPTIFIQKNFVSIYFPAKGFNECKYVHRCTKRQLKFNILIKIKYRASAIRYTLYIQ
jgi:hypothetical protein